MSEAQAEKRDSGEGSSMGAVQESEDAILKQNEKLQDLAAATRQRRADTRALCTIVLTREESLRLEGGAHAVSLLVVPTIVWAQGEHYSTDTDVPALPPGLLLEPPSVREPNELDPGKRDEWARFCRYASAFQNKTVWEGKGGAGPWSLAIPPELRLEWSIQMWLALSDGRIAVRSARTRAHLGYLRLRGEEYRQRCYQMFLLPTTLHAVTISFSGSLHVWNTVLTNCVCEVQLDIKGFVAGVAAVTVPGGEGGYYVEGQSQMDYMLWVLDTLGGGTVWKLVGKQVKRTDGIYTAQPEFVFAGRVDLEVAEGHMKGSVCREILEAVWVGGKGKVEVFEKRPPFRKTASVATKKSTKVNDILLLRHELLVWLFMDDGGVEVVRCDAGGRPEAPRPATPPRVERRDKSEDNVPPVEWSGYAYEEDDAVVVTLTAIWGTVIFSSPPLSALSHPLLPSPFLLSPLPPFSLLSSLPFFVSSPSVILYISS